MTACGCITRGIFAVGMPTTAIRADVTCARCLLELGSAPTAPEAAPDDVDSKPTAPETASEDCINWDEGHRFMVVNERGGVVLWRCARCKKEYLQQ